MGSQTAYLTKTNQYSKHRHDRQQIELLAPNRIQTMFLIQQYNHWLTGNNYLDLNLLSSCSDQYCQIFGGHIILQWIQSSNSDRDPLTHWRSVFQQKFRKGRNLVLGRKTKAVNIFFPSSNQKFQFKQKWRQGICILLLVNRCNIRPIFIDQIQRKNTLKHHKQDFSPDLQKK